MNQIMGRLFFLFGVCLPFYAVGPQISNGLWPSPSIFIGGLIATIYVITRGVTTRLLLLVAMIMIFALTAIARHPPSTYVYSLIMLFVVMAPLCLSRLSSAHQLALTKGFIFGLCATLFLVWVEIITQIFGLSILYEGVVNLFITVQSRAGQSNLFVFYQRPQAAFLEPAHLAIYLVMSLTVLDIAESRLADRLRTLTILTILFVGSVVGYVLLLGYFITKVARLIRHFWFGIRRQRSRNVFSSVRIIVLSLMVFVFFLREATVSIFEVVAGRISLTFDVLQTGTMTGSEGSRANMYRIIFDHWQIEGLPGFLYGTGYGNVSDWLIATYGHLGVWSAAGRGQLNSIIVAVFLSTGLLGGIVYLLFTIACLKTVGRDRFMPLLFMFVILNFAYGFLIAYPMWHLLAVIIFLSQGKFGAVEPSMRNRFLPLREPTQ